MKPSFSFEKSLWKKGIKYVIGIDEVGRGAFAGPLVAAGVVFYPIKKVNKKLKFLNDINDSKKLTAENRRELSRKIIQNSFLYHIEEVNIETINKIGIGKANHLIIKRIALILQKKLNNKNCFVICDGLPIPKLKNHHAVVHGDCKSITIAAASIIAKVYRDKLMREYSKKYHNYKFARNKGYGTKSHQEALRKYGLTEIHRTSFELTRFLSR